ncbi:hypothetical protein [Listeria newyorkensis]|uniref:hypothetical protein n=1 Tax=Listeria newyorkensis TaxID=1497681 RepID=UPI00051CF949|nr:hypothetical protein [Listeria newyorkensis]KGL45699.1 hypothetical protein EP58_03125 [Listeria newyorkensis]
MVKRYRTNNFLMQYVIYDGESYPAATVVSLKKSIIGKCDIEYVQETIKELYAAKTNTKPNEVSATIVSIASLRVGGK